MATNRNGLLGPFLRDVSVFGGATAVTTVLGIIQVFLVPKLLDVETFGFLRIYLVYVGYVGALHLGLADGALLRWAGREPRQIAAEWRTAARWMLSGQGLVTVLGGAIALLFTDGPAATIVAGLGAAALLVNWSTLAGFALQAARDFAWAGRAAVLQPAIFLTGLTVLPDGSRTIVAAVALWLLGHAVTGLAVSARILTLGRKPAPAPAGSLEAAGLLRVGLPAMLANSAAVLVQSIDRVVLSWAIPVAQFALYGFAASALFAANAGTHVLNRVALPHVARVDSQSRASFLTRLQFVILLGYGAGLLAYPLFEFVVRLWLPAYAPALPVARALIIGALFFTASQTVQATAFRATGRLNAQLMVTLIGVGIVAAATVTALALGLPLAWVAAAASLGMAVAWLLGGAALHRDARTTGITHAPLFATLGVAQYAALLLSMVLLDHVVVQTAAYAALAALPTWLAARRLQG